MALERDRGLDKRRWPSMIPKRDEVSKEVLNPVSVGQAWERSARLKSSSEMRKSFKQEGTGTQHMRKNQIRKSKELTRKRVGSG